MVLNVTASVPTAAGWLTVYPNGSTPTASNLNFVPGQTVPNLVTVKVAVDNTITVRNSFGAPSGGTVQVIIDVVGWYGPAGDSSNGGTQFHTMSPKRLMDDRASQANATPNPSLNTAIAPRATVQPVVTGGSGSLDTTVPDTAKAVALNATVTGPSANGWLTLFPDPPNPPPTASNLNFVAGQTVPTRRSSR